MIMMLYYVVLMLYMYIYILYTYWFFFIGLVLTWWLLLLLGLARTWGIKGVSVSFSRPYIGNTSLIWDKTIDQVLGWIISNTWNLAKWMGHHMPKKYDCCLHMCVGPTNQLKPVHFCGPFILVTKKQHVWILLMMVFLWFSH